MALVKHSIMTVSCCPIKCFMIKQNVRERLFDYSLEGLFFLRFFADLWHDGPQAGVKYYYYVVACKNSTTYNWKPSDNKYDDDEYDFDSYEEDDDEDLSEDVLADKEDEIQEDDEDEVVRSISEALKKNEDDLEVLDIQDVDDVDDVKRT